MSTVRSIERRLYARRAADRELQTSRGAESGERLQWNGVWTGYAVWAGLSVLFVSFVFGVGFSNLHPTNAASWAGIGGGTLLWTAIALFLATFLGAMWAGSVGGPLMHRFMRAFTLWGLIQISVLLLVVWVAGTVATTAASAAATVAPTAANAGVDQVQATLRSQGVTVTSTQAAAISGRMLAGDQTGAAQLLAQDAGISPADASSALTRMSANGGLSNVGRSAANAVRTGGTTFSWSLFWFSLISLGCAILGGAASHAAPRRRQPRPAAA